MSPKPKSEPRALGQRSWTMPAVTNHATPTARAGSMSTRGRRRSRQSTTDATTSTTAQPAKATPTGTTAQHPTPTSTTANADQALQRKARRRVANWLTFSRAAGDDGLHLTYRNGDPDGSVGWRKRAARARRRGPRDVPLDRQRRP